MLLSWLEAMDSTLLQNLLQARLWNGHHGQRTFCPLHVVMMRRATTYLYSLAFMNSEYLDGLL